jgi:hypothetical protein
MTTKEFKSDKTRLFNLLDNYRNHIITGRANKLGGSTKRVEEVDEAIRIIKNGM